MTNLAAYLAWNSDATTGSLSLQEYGIDEGGDCDNVVAAALGMMDKVVIANYSQGDTSEQLSNSARSFLLSRGKRILLDNGIEYRGGSKGTEINTNYL